MARLSSSITIIVCAIAAYFMLHWGTDAIGIVASPMHGMDKPTFAHVVQNFARMFGLTQTGAIVCAVTFGTAKLGVAAIFSIYLLRRLTGIGDGEADHDLLEAGLVLVVVTVAAMALPLVTDENPAALNQFRVPLWLVGLAATFTMLERAVTHEAPSRAKTWNYDAIPATLPPQRGRVSAMRWNQLRREANIDCGR